MPNTPAQLRRGMTVWYATPEVTATQREATATLLAALGPQIEVEDEKFVAMATAVSGTGPAYVFLVMEALIDAAVHLGFPRHVAHDLVIETLEGSTAFAKASAMHPAQLRNMVTSPGGTTAAALHELKRGRLRTVLVQAVWAAYRRTDELGHQIEADTAAMAVPRHPRQGRHGRRSAARRRRRRARARGARARRGHRPWRQTSGRAGHVGWQRLFALFVIASFVETVAFGHLFAFLPLLVRDLGVPESDVPQVVGLPVAWRRCSSGCRWCPSGAPGRSATAARRSSSGAPSWRP